MFIPCGGEILLLGGWATHLKDTIARQIGSHFPKEGENLRKIETTTQLKQFTNAYHSY